MVLRGHEEDSGETDSGSENHPLLGLEGWGERGRKGTGKPCLNDEVEARWARRVRVPTPSREDRNQQEAR